MTQAATERRPAPSHGAVEYHNGTAYVIRTHDNREFLGRDADAAHDAMKRDFAGEFFHLQARTIPR